MSSSLSKARPRQSLRGFTFPELLVVIAIIAILIALLFPTINRAQQSAYQVKCEAQMSQIISTVYVHAQAHQGYAPLVGLLETVSLNPDGMLDKPMVKYKYVSFNVFGEDSVIEAFTASLAAEMGDPRIDHATSVDDLNITNNDPNGYMRIFRCPSNKIDPGPVHEFVTYCIDPMSANVGISPPLPIIYWADSQSYVYNEAALGWNDALNRGRGQVSRVRHQSQTMLMADGVGGIPSRMGLNFTTLYNKVADGPITVADALAGNGKAGDTSNFDPARHHGSMNIGFFDGHVEARSVSAQDLSNVYLIAPQ